MVPVKKKSPRVSHAANGSQPARRQRGTKEATRERLLQAAVELIRKRGVEALSTVSVTEAAGFAQSSFYMHFKNVDECLRAAAEKVARESRAFIAEHRRLTHRRLPKTRGLTPRICGRCSSSISISGAFPNCWCVIGTTVRRSAK